MKALCILLLFVGAFAVRREKGHECDGEGVCQAWEEADLVKPQKLEPQQEKVVDQKDVKPLVQEGAVVLRFRTDEQTKDLVFWTRPLGMLLEKPARSFLRVLSVYPGSPAAELGVQPGWLVDSFNSVSNPEMSHVLRCIGDLPQRHSSMPVDEYMEGADVGPGAFTTTHAPGALTQDDLSGKWYYFADWQQHHGDRYFTLKKHSTIDPTKYQFDAEWLDVVDVDERNVIFGHLRGELSKSGEWYEGRLDRSDHWSNSRPTSDSIRVRLEGGNVMFSYNKNGKEWQPESIGVDSNEWRVFSAWADKGGSNRALFLERTKVGRGDCSDRALLEALGVIDVVRHASRSSVPFVPKVGKFVSDHITKKREPVGVLPIFQEFQKFMKTPFGLKFRREFSQSSGPWSV